MNSTLKSLLFWVALVVIAVVIYNVSTKLQNGENQMEFSAFMAQAGTLVICGDAAGSLGDSLYEAVIYVRGKLHSLGADAREEPMGPADEARLRDLLGKASINYAPKEFKRVASARKLYHWNSEHDQEY